MKKKSICSLLLLCSLVVSLLVLPAAAAEAPELQCRNAVLLDATYGDVLYEKAAREKAYPASLTKVMTALLVLEALDSGVLTPDTPVTADEYAREGLNIYSSTAGIKYGQTLTVEELLYCLLLPSANEAANMLAIAVDGSAAAFVDHMNRRAAELGAKGTHFLNPHGLHDDEHYTTAYDMALFMEEALKHDLFRTIIGSKDHRIPATDSHPEFYFYNTNALISNLHYRGYVYEPCIGGKTGSTDEAGRCLVSAAEQGDKLLISVVLGSGVILDENGNQKQGQFTESTKLLKWGFSNFKRVTITRSAEPVDKVAVTLSRQADEVMVKPEGSITRTLPIDMDVEDIEETITLFSDTVEAPVEEGQVLGTMTLSLGDRVYGTLDLVAVTSVERSDLLYKKAQVVEFFQTFWVRMVVVALSALVLGLLVYLLVIRKKRRYRSRYHRPHRNYRGGRR